MSLRQVGNHIVADNANWTFGGEVPDSFDAHVEKSVPFYHEGHQLVTRIADFFLPSRSLCYDLGCSTGQLLHTLATRNIRKDVRFVGIDEQAGMLARARERCQEFPSVTFQQADLVDADLDRADLIVSYYTIQFIRPKWRQEVINRIYNALHWGGGFLLFEKVRAPDARFQDMMSAIYHDFKLEQGFTPDEVMAKAGSLKGVLEPFSMQGNLSMLQRAGFVDITSVFKYVCWEGFLAIK
jgi:tRNA (cmo5U34)-methyltransferase